MDYERMPSRPRSPGSAGARAGFPAAGPSLTGRPTGAIRDAMRRAQAPSGLPQLAALLERFARAEVVLAGDLVADEYLYGETERISREAPVLIVRWESSELKPGCAGNAALNLAALGVKVRAV